LPPSPGSTRPSRPYAPRNVSMPLVERIPWIVRRCTGQAVLNLGCMHAPNTQEAIRSGLHLHLALLPVCASLTGVDLDLSARGLLPPDSDAHDIREADVCDQEELGLAIAGRTYDVVLAGELLEHLPNPGLCLDAVGAMLPTATLIVTVPNALGRDVARRARRGVETVHEDHVCWYSPRTIITLLEKCGWTRNSLSATGRPGIPYGRGNVLAPGLLVESRRT
jgi:hypothetical protein